MSLPGMAPSGWRDRVQLQSQLVELLVNMYIKTIQCASSVGKQLQQKRKIKEKELKLSLLKLVDKLAFVGTVASAAVSAVAGGNGWTRTAVASGCLAAAIPIVNRWSSARLAFAPRMLSEKQVRVLKNQLGTGPGFSLWLNHNREEGEPAALHAQFNDALTAAGLDVKWYGGLTNSITGIEISGPDIPEKKRIMKAFRAAKINFTNVFYGDAPSNEHSPLNTAGVSVSIGRRF